MALKFAKLNRSSIRKLRPGQKIAEHGITVERLVVHKIVLANNRKPVEQIEPGDLRYSVNVMVDGKRVHRIIGRDSEGVTRTQCEEFIEQARTDARHGRLNLPNGRKLAMSFTTAAQDYLKRLDEEGGKNLAAKQRHLRVEVETRANNKRHPKLARGHLTSYFGAMRLAAISEFTINKYKKQRRSEGATPATVNRELATLSHLLNRAVAWKWLDRLPAKPQKFGESAGRIIALNEEQCAALTTSAIASPDPDLWLFVAFGLNTAMRHSEILAVRWDQLDLARYRLFIPDAKAGQREQPITPELAELLVREREMRDDGADWVFPSPRSDSRTGHRQWMGDTFRAAVAAADLDPEPITPHVMRHTAITRLVEAGVDLPTIQRISGHKTLAMVLRYTHVHGRHIDQAIRVLGRTMPQRPENAITPELHTPPTSRTKPDRARVSK